MIGRIDIRANAAHPNFPLPPVYMFAGAPSSPRVFGVPVRIGSWAITAVSVVVAYPDNSTKTVPLTQTDGMWIGVIPACATTGAVQNGVQIVADGTDENGDAVTGYCLGVGDLFVMERDFTATADGTRYYFHYCEETPAPPQVGDAVYADGVLKWWDGTAWRDFGGSSITVDPALSPTSENPVQNRAVTGALAQKRGLGDLAVYAPTFSEWTFTPLVEGAFLSTGPDWIATEEDFNESAYFGVGLWDGAGWYAICGIEGSGVGAVHPSGGEHATELLISSDGKLTRTVTAWTPASPADAIAKTSQLPTVPSAYASTPAMDGAGSAGSSTAWARGDHVHPSDTSRAAKTDLPYPFVPAEVTQEGPWAFSDDDAAYEVSETESGGTWSYDLSIGGSPVDTQSFGSRQTSVEFSFIPSGEAVAVTVTATRSNVLTVQPRTVATYTAGTTAASFSIAIGTGTTGAARDCVLVVDCATNTGAVAPTVTWPSNFHPRTDAEEIAPVAGARNVFYISEYAAGEFVVGGWHEEVA